MAKDRVVVFVKGEGEVVLTTNNYISSGGEGSVWAKNGTAYKLYHDPSKMIPLGKIQELSVLDDPNIIRPLNVLLDKQGKPIGYTMRQLPETVPLPRLFTKAFKVKERISHEKILDMVIKMAKRLTFIHSRKIIVVDYNEMNFAALKDFSDTLNFDVDSYQTPSYGATALMESVRDRHAKIKSYDSDGRPHYEFNEGTDFFSFAVVSFQLFIGIHPYKGRHPKIKYDDAAKTLDERMGKNISVMNSEVAVPPVCYPLDVIPNNWRDWYRQVFEKGIRIAPPLDKGTITAAVKFHTIGMGDKLKIVEILTTKGDIVGVYYSSGQSVILTDQMVIVNKQHLSFSQVKAVGFTTKYNHAIIGYLEKNQIKLYNSTLREEITVHNVADAMFDSGGRIYFLTGCNVMEMQFMELTNQTIAAPKIVAQVLPQATQAYNGVVIQNILGSIFATIFPATNTSYQIHLSELEKCKIIDAKYENHVLMVVGFIGGKYDCFIFRFNNSFDKYDCRIVADVQTTGLNFTVLDKNICVTLNEDDTLEIFHNQPGTNQITHIKDKELGDIQLFHDGITTLAAKGNKLYSITTK